MTARILSALVCLAAWQVALARAQPARTALVLVPADRDPLIAEVTARLCGELVAEGFTVTRRAARPGLRPQRAVESAWEGEGASAVLLIAPAAEGDGLAPLTIWLSDRSAGHTSMARLQSATEEKLTPGQLTVRAVELLRARLSERALSADTATDEPWEIVPARESVVRSPPAAGAKRRERVQYGLGLGGGSMQNALGSTWLPVMSFAVGLPLAERLALDLGLSGGAFGQRAHATREEGSATIAQAFVSAAAAVRLRSEHSVEPSLRIAAGGHVMHVEGRTSTPFVAHDSHHVSPFASVGLSLRSPRWRSLCAALSADVMIMMRPGAVMIAAQEVARTGRTNALLRAELMAVF